jgi:large subunit ribosomal protein L22
MEIIVKSQLKNAQTSAQKARLVTNLVKKMPVRRATEVLSLLKKKAALPVLKVFNSAIASAKELHNADIDTLEIKSLTVDEGITYKRVRYGSRTRVSRIHKERSHINLELKVK